MSEFKLPEELTLTFDEARAIYLTLSEAFDEADEGSELRFRLDTCKAILSRKFLGELGRTIMKNVEGKVLISVTEAARRLGISPEAAFDLAFVSRVLPVVITAGREGIPEDAVEDYRGTHLA